MTPPRPWHEIFASLWKGVCDDRGAPSRVRPFWRSRTTANLIRQAEAQWLRLRRAHPIRYRRVTTARLLVLAVWTVALLAGIGVVINFGARSNAPGVLSLIVIVAFVVLMMRFLQVWEDRLRFHITKAYFLRDHVCPCCGDSLRDCATEDDGCRVCLECGRAWEWPSREHEAFQ